MDSEAASVTWIPEGEELLHRHQISTDMAADKLLESLTPALKDSDPKVRRAAVKALGRLYSKDSFRNINLYSGKGTIYHMLASALKDPDLTVRMETADCFAELYGQWVSAPPDSVRRSQERRSSYADQRLPDNVETIERYLDLNVRASQRRFG